MASKLTAITPHQAHQKLIISERGVLIRTTINTNRFTLPSNDLMPWMELRIPGEFCRFSVILPLGGFAIITVLRRGLLRVLLLFLSREIIKVIVLYGMVVSKTLGYNKIYFRD